ncbi:hypothetical protein N9W17_00630 [Jannaschia sp.]|nr:hypothetical protein [Jannaschia sp.]
MARTFKEKLAILRREPVFDVLGGVWLVTLLVSLLHLPTFLA